ncbi:unnamed protein product [Musa acuminata subsp. burmannicoides]
MPIVFKSSAKDSARRPCGISLPDGHPWLYHHGGYTGDTSPWGSAKDSARRPCGISLPDGHPWLYHHGATVTTSPWGEGPLWVGKAMAGAVAS